MIRLLKYCLIIFFSFSAQDSFSQFYNTGSAPFKVKWQSIKTDHFRLIYPTETESFAQKYASDLIQLYPYTSFSLNHQPDKVDIIMYNQSVISNAYVVWAPKRMEVVTTSPQRAYAHDWLEQLALHEYRHVVQVDKLNQGFTKGLSIFMGQMGVGAMMGFIPLWYLEGDAVVTETALTNSGRGRDPNFIQEVRAAEMQRHKRFKYDEFYLGTYKDYTPNHYQYGYFMVAWSRMKYGSATWDKVLNNVGRRPFTLAPFYFKLKKETGLSKVSLYEETSDYLKQTWEKEDSSNKTSSDTDLIELAYKSNFVSYRFPYQNKDGSLLALRTSIDDIAKIVRLENGNEKVLIKLGYFQGSSISYSDKYIAWEEIQYHPRWERKNYSIIRIFDRQTRKSEVLQRKERHFAPDISPNSNKICLIRDDGLYSTYLDIYNIETKQLLKTLQFSKTAKLSFPTWINNDQIAVVVLSEKGKSIYMLSISTGKWQELLAPGFENISNLNATEEGIYFSYTLDGKVNIYHHNLLSKDLKRVTSMPIGSNFASADNSLGRLTFSEYTAQGYKPRSIQIEPDKWESVEEIDTYSYSLAEANASQERINIQDSLFALKEFDSKPYRKVGHLFNLHSWLVPFYVNLDALPDEKINLLPGITLLSQNSLSTVTSSLSYYYENGYHHLRPTVSLKMFYPVLTLDYDIGGAPNLETSLANPGAVPQEIGKNYELNTTISLPLNFSTSQYTLSFTPLIRHQYRNLYVADSNSYNNSVFYQDQIYYYKGYSMLDYRISLYAATKLAYKDLRPRWGIYYYLSHLTPLQHTRYWPDNTVHLITAYVPGFYRHHSIRGQLGIEKGFGSRMATPRGYAPNYLLNSYNSAIKVSGDYMLPLLYPNFSLGPVAYFKRIQANVFYDYFTYSRDYPPDNTLYEYEGSLSSVGVELGVETNILRFFWTFVPTIRFSYLIESGRYNWGFFMTYKMGFALGGMNTSENFTNHYR